MTVDLEIAWVILKETDVPLHLNVTCTLDKRLGLKQNAEQNYLPQAKAWDKGAVYLSA